MRIAGLDVVHLAAAAAAAVASLASNHPAPRSAAAASTVLAAADFQADPVGAAARPYGPPTALEDLWEDSTCESGMSAVVSTGGGGRAYRISDAGSEDAHRGVRLPFSATVSSGTLDVKATVTAGQEGSEGGTLACEEPAKQDWFARMGFGGDGDFTVQGASTGVPYSANTKYLFRITVNYGSPVTADFRAWDLATNELVLESTGHELVETPTAAALTFRTGDADNGVFTIDDIQASAN